MTVTRFDAATHLEVQFSTLAREVSQLSASEESGYEHDIDWAMRKLDVSRDDLPTATIADNKEDVFYALAEYAALRRFLRLLSVKVDINTAYVHEADRNAIFRNVQRLLEMAKQTLDEYGYSVGDDEGWQLGRLNLDFLEPEPAD